MSSKLREALGRVSDILETWCDNLPPIIQDEAEEAIALADAALDEPLRNCEVGTPEEQYARLGSFCVKHFRYANDNPCAKCPIFKDDLFKDDSPPCVFKFLQMPYEKGEV